MMQFIFYDVSHVIAAVDSKSVSIEVYRFEACWVTHFLY